MSVLRATTISDLAGTGPVTLTGQSAAKAWCSFNGTVSSGYVLDSFNSSTFTDVGVGQYKFSFTSGMGNANYASPAGYGESETADHGVRWPYFNSSNTTSETQGLANNGNGDVGRIHVTILGDLA